MRTVAGFHSLLRGGLGVSLSLAVVLLFPAVTLASGYEPPAPSGYRLPADPPGAEYVLEAKIAVDGEAAVVEGSGAITLANPTRRPLTVLALEWSGDPEAALDVSDRGRPLRLLNAAMHLPLSRPLFFELPSPLLPGWKTRLEVRFTSRFAVSNGRIQLQAWYPRLWWEGIPVRDAFKVKVDAPPGWAMATSGRLDSRSGRYENPCVTTRFGIFLASDMKAETRESAGVLITALHTDKGRACALHCLEAAADIIAFYRNWLGVYPHRSLSIIPGGPQPWGGYPFASGIVVIHGQETFDPNQSERRRNWWTWITAHEIGHQYWGEFVMPADVRTFYTDAWFMIGMGICADKAYMLGRGLGWDQHRAFIDRYLQGVRERNDTTMDAPPSLARTQTFDINNVVVHGKGFAVLSALETVLGSRLFDAIYRRTVNSWAGRRIGWRDFRTAVEETTGRDFGWFFDQWVRSDAFLECRIVSRSSEPAAGGGFTSEVRVEYGLDSTRMPVPVEAVFEDGTTELRWTDRFARLNVFRFPNRSKLEEARLDPEGRLALIREPVTRSAAEIAETVRALDWTGTGETALEISLRPETQEVKTPFIWHKLGLLLYDGRRYPEAFEAFRRAAALGTADAEVFGDYVWMGILKDLEGERAEAVGFYRKALEHDAGQTLRHDQYGLRIDKAWVEARLETPFKRD